MGSSTGAQGKGKSSSSQVYRSIKIKNSVYNVWLRFRANDFSVHLENDRTGEHWFNAFTPDYIDEMTRKTGNQRRYNVFTSMLASALEKTSARKATSQAPPDLSLDLLFVEDLERMKEASGGAHNESIDATIQSASNKARCFLIIAYAVEFERTFYPLPLNKSGQPSTSLEEWLMFAYNLTKERLRRIQEENGMCDDFAESSSGEVHALRAEVKRQKEIIASLEKEHSKTLEVAKHVALENNILKDQLAGVRSSVVTRAGSTDRPPSREPVRRGTKTGHSSVRSSKTSRSYVDQPPELRTRGHHSDKRGERESSRPPSRTHSQLSNRSETGHSRRSISHRTSEQPSPAVGSGNINLSHARSRSSSVGNSQAMYGSNASAMSASLNPFRRTTSIIHSASVSEFDEGLSQQLVDKARRSSSKTPKSRRRRRSSSSHKYRDEVRNDGYYVQSTEVAPSRSHTHRSAQYEEYVADTHRSGSSSRRRHRKEGSGVSRSEKYY